MSIIPTVDIPTVKPFAMEYDEAKKEGTITIYGSISSYEWSPKNTSGWSFSKELEKYKDADTVKIRINSPGGSVNEGFTVYNLIKGLKAKTIAMIDGFACSISALIPMGCDEVIMSDVSMMMIHSTSTITYGTAKEHKEAAETLEKITKVARTAFKSKADISDEKFDEIFAKDTWLSPDECLEMGLCDKVIRSKDETMSFDIMQIKNLVTTNKELESKILKLNAKIEEFESNAPTPQPEPEPKLKTINQQVSSWLF